MSIKIEFPAYRTDIAEVMGHALLKIAASAEAPPYKVGPDAPSEGPAPVTKATAEECTSALDEGPLPEHSVVATAESVALCPTGAAATDEATQLAGTTANVDLHGVTFEGQYCAVASEPFYTSGKMQGQWKKKRGVDQSVYDAWYASRTSASEASAVLTPEPINAGASFSAAAETAATETPVPTVDANVPQDAGSLMVWVSEQQASGAITQEDVNAAWATAGLTSPADLLRPDAGPLVAAVYNALNASTQA